MRTIWKYPLQVADKQTVALPLSHKILSVQYQDGQLCLWALVKNGDGTTLNVEVCIYGTGSAVPDDPGTYLATVLDGDCWVWHVFYRPLT